MVSSHTCTHAWRSACSHAHTHRHTSAWLKVSLYFQQALLTIFVFNVFTMGFSQIPEIEIFTLLTLYWEGPELCWFTVPNIWNLLASFFICKITKLFPWLHNLTHGLYFSEDLVSTFMFSINSSKNNYQNNLHVNNHVYQGKI